VWRHRRRSRDVGHQREIRRPGSCAERVELYPGRGPCCAGASRIASGRFGCTVGGGGKGGPGAVAWDSSPDRCRRPQPLKTARQAVRAWRVSYLSGFRSGWRACIPAVLEMRSYSRETRSGRCRRNQLSGEKLSGWLCGCTHTGAPIASVSELAQGYGEAWTWTL